LAKQALTRNENEGGCWDAPDRDGFISGEWIMDRERWQEVCKKTGKCDRCPPHDGENRKRRAKKSKKKPKRDTIRK